LLAWIFDPDIYGKHFARSSDWITTAILPEQYPLNQWVLNGKHAGSGRNKVQAEESGEGIY